MSDVTAAPELSRSGRTALAALVTLLMVLTATPANASGEFDFDAKFRYGLTSREWYQNAGNTTISATIGCGPYPGPGVTSYEVRLQRKSGLFWNQVGPTVEYSCGTFQTYTWKNTQSGTYRFNFRKANDNNYFDGDGVVKYS